MINLKEKTVADFVNENIKTADIFKKNGIDFCCGGGITVKEACQRKNLDHEKLLEELENIDHNISRAYDYKNWSLDFLIDHIVNIHHSYVLEAIPILIQYADKVAKVHGNNYQELKEINSLVHQVSKELLAHMEKEEQILFPYVKTLINAEKAGSPIETPPFQRVENPIRMMEAEHEIAGDVFKKLRELTNNYTPPLAACNTFKALYAKLEEFETDLHQHVHLENNILFPRSKNLENKLKDA